MTTPECKDILNLIPLYVDNLLDEDEVLTVKEHIDRCESCKQELDLMVSIMARTTQLPQVKASSDFSAKVTAKAKLQKVKHHRAALLRRISSGVAVAAVLALCVVSFDVIDEKSTPPENTPVLSAENVSRKDIINTPKNEQTKENSRAVTEEVAVPDLSTEMLPDETVESYTPALFCEVDLEYYTIATVEITEENELIVNEFIKDYEKDDFGYIVPDMNILLRKLSEAGIKVKTEVSPDKTNDYVIIE